MYGTDVQLGLHVGPLSAGAGLSLTPLPAFGALSPTVLPCPVSIVEDTPSPTISCYNKVG